MVYKMIEMKVDRTVDMKAYMIANMIVDMKVCKTANRMIVDMRVCRIVHTIADAMVWSVDNFSFSFS